MTIRLLVRCTDLFTLSKLGMTDEQLAAVEGMLASSAGLILVTGPTGSGKSMSLYACLRKLNNGERKINTIEDPVEYPIAGLRQSQVNPAVELGFHELLRGVLRQAPDVIMIGEIRDPETAETTVRAANSGHLVLATIHASTAAAAVQSIRALGVHPHFLSVALRGIIAQRLVRTLCPQCKQVYDVSDTPEFFSEVRPWLSPGEGQALCSPVGCPACGGLGYTGRSGVFEVMNVSRSIRNLIFEGRSAREIHEKALEDGMLSFRQSALLKVARGQTSTDEVFRVIPTDVLMVDD
jgi:type II secretory ATPase GspE/PulE/Tfp pilus assembly ATPase PilB-like protein